MKKVKYFTVFGFVLLTGNLIAQQNNTTSNQEITTEKRVNPEVNTSDQQNGNHEITWKRTKNPYYNEAEEKQSGGKGNEETTGKAKNPNQ